MFLHWILSGIFLGIRMSFIEFLEEDLMGKGAVCLSMLTLTLELLAEAVFVRVLHCKTTLLLSMIFSFGRKYSSHLRIWSYNPSY